MQDQITIVFHTVFPFHDALLQPIAEQVKSAGIQVCRVTSLEEIASCRPKVIVTAHGPNPLYRNIAPQAMVVFTRHGFSWKKVFRRVAEASDYTCMPSPWITNDAIARGVRPRLGFWNTGFVGMDVVFRALREDSLRQPLPLLAQAPPHSHVLLYAPTFNEEFSAESVLGPEWIGRLRQAFPDLCILIKPHPVTADRQPAWVRRWHKAATVDPWVRLSENFHEDIYPYFLFADALLTDASSIMFYFLAMDKPILLVTNPRRSQSIKYYDPEGPEWTWRDMGVEIGNPTDLMEAVGEALADPQKHAERRRFYRERVFGEMTDGRAAERIAERIIALLRPPSEQAEWVRQAWWAHATLRERDQRIALLEAEKAQPLTKIISARIAARFSAHWRRLKAG
jgi:CDP-glycerol glycerophosphotransferase (TagB/SpsB family)